MLGSMHAKPEGYIGSIHIVVDLVWADDSQSVPSAESSSVRCQQCREEVVVT